MKNRFNIYLFDGPHGEQDQYDGIILAQAALSNPHIVIVDDWNYPQVRRGTLRGLIDINCQLKTTIEIRTTFDGSHADPCRQNSDWHNGYFIAEVLRREDELQTPFYSWVQVVKTGRL